jgi:polysaccharide export outer membrane protein
MSSKVIRFRSPRGPFRAAVWLAAFWALVGCGSAPVAQQATGGTTQANQTENYLIGPGDVLNVFVSGEPEYSVTVPVRPDGRISTPTVEDMVAVGKTPSQLARDIESVLAVELRDPRVTIIVQDFVGTFSTQIRVLGEVVNPGSFPYRNGMTVFDAVAEAGGLTEFAAGRRAKLMRMVNADEQQEIRIRVDRLMEKGDLSENRALVPGDVIVVPGAVF